MNRRAVHWLRTSSGNFRRAASLPVTDRGFRYGMAVFETIGVRRGTALFLAEHLQQCLAACRESAFAVEDIWFQQAGDLLREYLYPAATGVARLHVTAGDGAPADPADRCRLLLSYEPREPVPAVVYTWGYRLGICPVPFTPTLNGRKTHNYWPNVTGLQAVRAAGADEGLVFNPAGELASACMANVFVVLEDQRVVTPLPSSGARNGVVRQWVLRQGNVQEAALKRSDLQHAREVFLSSSWLGVMPGLSVDGVDLPATTVAKELMAKYQCLLN